MLQVIASDKTGTLTQNRMTVENVWVNGQFKQVVDYARTNQDTVMVPMKDDDEGLPRPPRGYAMMV
jgi:Ca2+-transporting ATPase